MAADQAVAIVIMTPGTSTSQRSTPFGTVANDCLTSEKDAIRTSPAATEAMPATAEATTFDMALGRIEIEPQGQSVNEESADPSRLERLGRLVLDVLQRAGVPVDSSLLPVGPVAG